MLDSPRDFLGLAFKSLGLPLNCSFGQLKHSEVSLLQLKARVQQLHKQVTGCALVCCLPAQSFCKASVHVSQTGYFTWLAVVVRCLQLGKASVAYV